MSAEKITDPHDYSIDNLPPFMQHWKDAVESGSTPEHIAKNCYHETAELKGRIAEDWVQGFEDIREYFVKFTDGKTGARIEFETIAFNEDLGYFHGNYTFHWRDDSGIEQSLPATYKFMPSDLNPDEAKIGKHYSHPRSEL